MDFVRAGRRLSEASDANFGVRQALKSPHVAIDTFGRILGLSPDAALLFGAPSDRLIGRRLAHRINGSDRTTFHRALARLRLTQTPFSLSVTLRSADGLRPITFSLVTICGTNPSSVAVLKMTVDT